MLTGWDIYWITRLDSLNSIVEFIGGMGVVFAIMWTIVWIYTTINPDGVSWGVKELLSKTKFILWTTIICIFLSITLLSTKQMFAIKIVPAIVNNEEVKRLPSLAVKYATEWLEERLKEMEGE